MCPRDLHSSSEAQARPSPAEGGFALASQPCASPPPHPLLPPDRLLGLHRPPGLHLLLRPGALAVGEAPAAAAVLPPARYGQARQGACGGLSRRLSGVAAAARPRSSAVAGGSCEPRPGQEGSRTSVQFWVGAARSQESGLRSTG